MPRHVIHPTKVATMRRITVNTAERASVRLSPRQNRSATTKMGSPESETRTGPNPDIGTSKTPASEDTPMEVTATTAKETKEKVDKPRETAPQRKTPLNIAAPKNATPIKNQSREKELEAIDAKQTKILLEETTLTKPQGTEPNQTLFESSTPKKETKEVSPNKTPSIDTPAKDIPSNEKAPIEDIPVETKSKETAFYKEAIAVIISSRKGTPLRATPMRSRSRRITRVDKLPDVTEPIPVRGNNVNLEEKALIETKPIEAWPKLVISNKTISKESKPNQTTLKETTHKEVTPKDVTSKEPKDVNHKDANHNTTHREDVNKETTSMKATPKGFTSQEVLAKGVTPKEANPKSSTAKRAVPEETTPKEATPKEATPKGATSIITITEEATSEKAQSKDTTPKLAPPKEETQRVSTPKTVTPMETIPNETTSNAATQKTISATPKTISGTVSPMDVSSRLKLLITSSPSCVKESQSKSSTSSSVFLTQSPSSVLEAQSITTSSQSVTSPAAASANAKRRSTRSTFAENKMASSSSESECESSASVLKKAPGTSTPGVSSNLSVKSTSSDKTNTTNQVTANTTNKAPVISNTKVAPMPTYSSNSSKDTPSKTLPTIEGVLGKKTDGTLSDKTNPTKPTVQIKPTSQVTANTRNKAHMISNTKVAPMPTSRNSNKDTPSNTLPTKEGVLGKKTDATSSDKTNPTVQVKPTSQVTANTTNKAQVISNTKVAPMPTSRNSNKDTPSKTLPTKEGVLGKKPDATSSDKTNPTVQVKPTSQVTANTTNKAQVISNTKVAPMPTSRNSNKDTPSNTLPTKEGVLGKKTDATSSDKTNPTVQVKPTSQVTANTRNKAQVISNTKVAPMPTSRNSNKDTPSKTLPTKEGVLGKKPDATSSNKTNPTIQVKPTSQVTANTRNKAQVISNTKVAPMPTSRNSNKDTPSNTLPTKEGVLGKKTDITSSDKTNPTIQVKLTSQVTANTRNKAQVISNTKVAPMPTSRNSNKDTPSNTLPTKEGVLGKKTDITSSDKTNPTIQVKPTNQVTANTTNKAQVMNRTTSNVATTPTSLMRSNRDTCSKNLPTKEKVLGEKSDSEKVASMKVQNYATVSLIKKQTSVSATPESAQINSSQRPKKVNNVKTAKSPRKAAKMDSQPTSSVDPELNTTDEDQEHYIDVDELMAGDVIILDEDSGPEMSGSFDDEDLIIDTYGDVEGIDVSDEEMFEGEWIVEDAEGELDENFEEPGFEELDFEEPDFGNMFAIDEIGESDEEEDVGDEFRVQDMDQVEEWEVLSEAEED